MTRLAERIPTGRLVIPAEAGSGKTALVERLLAGDVPWKSRTCGVTARTAPQPRGRPASRWPPRAELRGLALPHRDRDFECVTHVTGQALHLYGPVAGE
ncbi:hypothetical protein T45_01000 [Streptomyces turgidiscabies]|nr:hypothetical protein T45_01000 [Streptomyces turgidiscabies]